MNDSTHNTLLGEIFRTLADVADGKISLEQAIKQTTNDKNEIKQMEKHYYTFNHFVASLQQNIKKEIKNAQLTNNFRHKYNSQSAVSIHDNQGNIQSFIGGRPKEKQTLWKKIKNRFSRSLRQQANFIDGQMNLNEFVHTSLKNLHQDYMEDSKVYRSSTSIIQGINRGIKRSIAELRGTTQTQKRSKIIPTIDSKTLNTPPNNPYDSLDNTQFSVALGTAYENLVRLQHNGCQSDNDKQEILSDFQQLIHSANKRFPNIQPIPQGSYFTDKEFAHIEAQLLPLLKESGKNNTVITADTKRYEEWRNNKPFTEMFITELPFHNSARYSHQDSSHFHTINTLKSPLQSGKNTMSDQQLQQSKAQIAKLSVR